MRYTSSPDLRVKRRLLYSAHTHLKNDEPASSVHELVPHLLLVENVLDALLDALRLHDATARMFRGKGSSTSFILRNISARGEM